MDRQVILNILLFISVLQFIWQPIAAKIAEHIGGVRVMILGLLLSMASIVPLFLAIMSASPIAIAAALGVSVLGGTAYYAMLASFLSHAFPVNVRFTGVALQRALCVTDRRGHALDRSVNPGCHPAMGRSRLLCGHRDRHHLGSCGAAPQGDPARPSGSRAPGSGFK